MTIPISFELAKLLKEKGINIWSEYRYTDFNGVERLEKEANGIFPFAPTIAEVVMWLYEKHGIWISVEPPSPKRIVLWEYYIQKSEDGSLLGQNSGYSSPTEAYEAAIEYVLNNLI